jgi:two-component system sensor histidine kinase KdpD
LRTPLASIIGAITSLRSLGKSLDERTRGELMGTVQDEAERLNRFVGNLLDMTRLESGALAPKQEMVDLVDLVGSALRRAATVLEHHQLDVDLEADLPMLRLDYLLAEQVLFNLLDNAAKYAPAGSRVTIAGRRVDNRAIIQVLDEGPGIAEADRERIFDKFYRVRGGDRQRAGTGLGLAICRGFVEAMGGRIAADNRPDRPGAVFTISLPVETGAQADLPEEEAIGG